MPGRNGRSRKIWDASARPARVSRIMAGVCFLFAGRNTNYGGEEICLSVFQPHKIAWLDACKTDEKNQIF